MTWTPAASPLPSGPGGPSGPTGPGGPGSPGSPVSPLAPEGPGSPAGPGPPGSPLTPGGPGGPVEGRTSAAPYKARPAPTTAPRNDAMRSRAASGPPGIIFITQTIAT